MYRSAHLGELQPNTGSKNTIKNVAPYWRLAWQQSFGANYLMFGTYGLYAQLYPSGVSGQTDDYTDLALDAQYEHPFGDDLLSVHGTFIHEIQDLNASAPDDSSNFLNVFRLDGTYHFGNRLATSAGFFQTIGSTNSALYATGEQVSGSSNGNPTSRGYRVQIAYLPWQNTQFVLQYTGYTKFNGNNNNYDGFGRSASDNNTVFLLGWLVF